MPITDGLVGLWHLNENGDDSSGNGNDVTIVGATSDTVNQKLGSGCYDFDGTDDYGTVANESNFDFLTDDNPSFAIMAWLKTADTSFELVTKNDQSIPEGMEFRGRSGFLDLVLATNGSNFIALRGSTAIDDNAYHQGIWVVDNEVSTLYVDNSTESLTDNSTGTFSGGPNDKPVLLGARFNGASREMFYDGLLDEIAIWNRPLTVGEVSTLWNGGAGIEIGVGGVGTLVNRGLINSGLIGGRLCT